mmetsp:Transcript_27134/g.58082  ORF Transcript_27134/g.58082 Transcript_27134/m.58082 type:complete len:355 (+) Transcript_27134:324-1388(+)
MHRAVAFALVAAQMRHANFFFYKHQGYHHHTFDNHQRCFSSSSDSDDGSDTLETLSEHLSRLLSANGNEGDGLNDSRQQRQCKILTSRLSEMHGLVGEDNSSEFVHINRTYVDESTIRNSGKGLFARKNFPKGTLLTCYPGDFLLDFASDSDGTSDSDIIDTGNGLGKVTWGPHVKKLTAGGSATYLHQPSYRLRAIRDDWVISGLTEIFGENDPSYLGHFANDGAQNVPTSESELAAYVIESSDRANAMHQECEACHMVTVATRNLKAGEEIFVTYGPEYWKGKASFVPSSSSQDYDDDVEELYVDDFDADDGFNDFEFDHDFYDDEAEAIVTEIISESEASSESPSRGKGFG